MHWIHPTHLCKSGWLGHHCFIPMVLTTLSVLLLRPKPFLMPTHTVCNSLLHILWFSTVCISLARGTVSKDSEKPTKQKYILFQEALLSSTRTLTINTWSVKCEHHPKTCSTFCSICRFLGAFAPV